MLPGLAMCVCGGVYRVGFDFGSWWVECDVRVAWGYPFVVEGF